MAFKRRLKFDKRIRFQKQMSIMYILLFVVLASLGVGYAYIKSNLNINGTANVTAARWDVHFTNLNVTTGSVTATTAASITDPTTVTFAATLDEPNDFYEFTVDVTNQGTMDAMIDSFSISPTLTTAQAKYLEYTVSYSDGVALANKQRLLQNTTETIKVRFSYIENSDKTNYPTEDQTFTIAFTMNYTQADSSAIIVNHPIIRYTVNLYSSNPLNIGRSIPNSIVKYETPEAALAALRLAANNNDIQFYLKHKIQDSIIIESYVGFIVSSEMAQANPGMTAGTYAIRGGINENSTTEKPVFELNKAIILQAFGSANCTNESNCGISNLTVRFTDNGMVMAFNGDWDCSIYYGGASYCDVDE